MTTYPLQTLAATISSTGISAPSYADVFLSLQASLQQIYGADIVLTPDSQDGQLIAIIARAIHDANMQTIAVYNSFSPATSQGAALSNNVKINGLKRLVPSNSTANVTIVGQAGTIITNGIVEDEGGYRWSLPETVTIPTGGSIVATATCTILGDISAAAGTITSIITPTRGWQSVTNAAEAVVGAPVESDATLRRRQTVSTGLPAQTVLEAIHGVIANLTGVQQVKVYENDTNVTDANGIPPHSISAVVQGGDATEIVEAIASKKSPGTGTFGTTSEVVVDANGVPNLIKFFAPTQVDVDITITIKALTGYVSTTGDQIKAAVAAYVAGLGIGGSDGFVYNSKLFYPANSPATSASYNITGIEARRDSETLSTDDIAIAFNEVPICAVSNITLVVT